MKKFYFILMAVAAIAFTSCGDRNTPNNPDDKKEETAKYASAEYRFSVSISDAFASVANLRLVYTGEDGKQKEETVMGSMTERVIKTNVPVDSTCVQVYISKKEGADFTESNLYAEESALGNKVMKLDFVLDGFCKTLDEKGNIIQTRPFLGAKSTKTMAVDNVESYIDKHATKPYVTCTLRFDSEGHPVE